MAAAGELLVSFVFATDIAVMTARLVALLFLCRFAPSHKLTPVSKQSIPYILEIHNKNSKEEPKMNKLVLAEKPAAARSIAAVLNANERGGGFLLETDTSFSVFHYFVA